jgi:hypothetical protein
VEQLENEFERSVSFFKMVTTPKEDGNSGRFLIFPERVLVIVDDLMIRE